MDSRAKQRLTGAVILVALFVLLVPELLTGPKTASTAPIDDQGERRVVFDVESPKPAKSETPAAEPPVNLAAPVEPSAARPAEQKPLPAQASTPTPAAVKPATEQPVEAKPAVVKPAVVKPADTKPSTPARAEPGQFFVQLGSFGVREYADRLVREMTAKGYAMSIAPTTTNGRQLYQVRVGPTRDRASAETLAAQLQREGKSGIIVAIP